LISYYHIQLKSWGLSNVSYFGKLKGDRIINTGYLTDVDHQHTFDKAYEFFHLIFIKIETKLNDQWSLGSADGGFIAMNIGVSAMLRTVDKIINYLVKQENLEPQRMNSEQLANAVYPYLDSVINFIDSLNSEGRGKLRRLFGSGATEKVVWEFLHSINKNFNKFNPEGLEQWVKETSGIFNTKSYELGHEKIEPLIDRAIKHFFNSKNPVFDIQKDTTSLVMLI